jgi:hypothetical protein
MNSFHGRINTETVYGIDPEMNRIHLKKLLRRLEIMCMVLTLSTQFQRIRQTSSHPISSLTDQYSKLMLEGQELILLILIDHLGRRIHVSRTLSITKRSIQRHPGSPI